MREVQRDGEGGTTVSVELHPSLWFNLITRTCTAVLYLVSRDKTSYWTRVGTSNKTRDVL